VEDPATAREALEAPAATLEVMDARPPVEEPPPMVIPEEAEVKEAAAAEEAPLAPLIRQLCYPDERVRMELTRRKIGTSRQRKIHLVDKRLRVHQ
jgi:hypothetical protein